MTMASVQWVSVEGSRVLYVDYRGTKTAAEMVALMPELVKQAKSAPQPIRFLFNFTGVPVPPEFMKAAKELAKKDFANVKRKSAVLGVDGLKGMLLTAYNAFVGASMKPFASEADAYTWLRS